MTVDSGVLRYRGLTSLSNHTSVCHHCSTQYSRNIREVLTFHTALLGKSEIDKDVSNDKSLVIHKSYGDILEASNEILSPKKCETASVGHSVRKSVLGKAVYLSMLARFSSINSLTRLGYFNVTTIELN